MTGCPQLMVTGLLMLCVTTSTDMPGSIRMPFTFLTCLVVIINLAIGFQGLQLFCSRSKGIVREGQNLSDLHKIYTPVFSVSYAETEILLQT